MADSFIFLRGWRDGLDILPPEQRAEAYDAILDYALDGIPYSGNNPAIGMLLAMILKQIDVHNQRYQDKKQKCKDAADARWNKQKDTDECESIRTDANAYERIGDNALNYNYNHNNNNNNKNLNHNSNDNTITQVNSNKIARKKIIPPTIQEVEEYCKSKGYNIDAELFVAHYQSNGWKQKGGNPIKDWKATVVTWFKNEKKNGNGIFERTRTDKRGESAVPDWSRVTEDDMQF